MKFETFAEVGPYEQRQLTKDEPSCNNGCLRIRKYQITVELVEEPIEVIQARIRTLWAEKSHHHTPLLLAAAREYGIDDELE